LVALLALAAPLAAAPLQREVDEAQRRRALALNDVTGDDPIKGHVKSLSDDPEGSRKLLNTAIAMTKEKEKEKGKPKAPPFNYNASYILAQTAANLKDLEAGRIFFRLCIDEGLKLRSSKKLRDSFIGFLELLFENKKYAESEKLCKEVLELPDEDGS